MPKLTPTAQSQHFAKTALELGHITIGWSRIEHTLDEFIALLTPLQLGQITDVVAGNYDFRRKVLVLRGLALLRHDDTDWLSDLTFFLDHTDNNLRPARNDVIHARWTRPSRTMVRVTKRTKIKRPHSNEPTIETEQAEPVSIQELRDLKKNIEDAWFALVPLLWYMLRDEPPVWPPTSKPISYKQYLQEAGLYHLVSSVRLRLERRQKSSPQSAGRKPIPVTKPPATKRAPRGPSA